MTPAPSPLPPPAPRAVVTDAEVEALIAEVNGALQRRTWIDARWRKAGCPDDGLFWWGYCAVDTKLALLVPLLLAALTALAQERSAAREQVVEAVDKIEVERQDARDSCENATQSEEGSSEKSYFSGKSVGLRLALEILGKSGVSSSAGASAGEEGS